MTKVDDEDYEIFNQYKWRYYRSTYTGYAGRSENNKTIYLHREILKPKDGLVVDHIDGDGLNNCRSNLQAVTQAENLQKARMKSNNTSGHIGVWWSKPSKKWAAEIMRFGKKRCLGLYENIEDAVEARKAAEI